MSPIPGPCGNYVEHLPESQRDGWGDAVGGAGSDLAVQGFRPCVYHGGYRLAPGTEGPCPACVQEGRAKAPDPAAPAEPMPAREAELHATVAAQRKLEIEREAIRRERIDLAIERGDVAGVRSLGGTDVAIREAEANHRRMAGEPPAPDVPGAETVAPERRLPVGAGRLPATAGDGEVMGGAAGGGGPAPVGSHVDQGRLEAVPTPAPTAQDESYRVVGMDWP